MVYVGRVPSPALVGSAGGAVADLVSVSFAPFGVTSFFAALSWACALGYILAPLRG